MQLTHKCFPSQTSIFDSRVAIVSPISPSFRSASTPSLYPLGMEFGAVTVSLDGLVGSDPGSKRKLCGSYEDTDSWNVFSSNRGSSKVAKLSDGCSAPNLSSQQMLCFSSSSASQPPAFSSFSYASSIGSNSNCAGVTTGGGNMSGGNLSGTVLGGGRGPFTPTQWTELEHQALIYKYINACVPVPSNLLIPIRKAFESAGFSGYGSGLLRPNTRWGGFPLRFLNSTDPEPGRCRRTDGKKWRCSKDAVADQKYCERHMNRGRHRSRKPVEDLNTGHPVSGGQTAATTTTSTGAANNTFGLKVGSAVPGDGASDNIYSNYQSGVLSLSSDPYENRFSIDKDNSYAKIQSSSSGFSITPPSTDLNSKAILFLESPSQRTSSLLNSYQNLGTLKDLTDRETDSNHSCRQFMNVQSLDATHLSVSVASHDNNVTSSPLRTGLEMDQVRMNLGVGRGRGYDDQVHKQTMNWISISWETSSMGGPLGEVLHNANSSSSSTDCKNQSALNLMTEGRDSSSSSALRSSHTGVLLKTAIGSVSNSRVESSPRAIENIQKLA